MAIRKRTAGDLPACVAVLRRVHELSGYPGRWPDDPAGWLGPSRLMTAWVAERDGAIAGHVGLSRGLAARCLLAATGKGPRDLAAIVRLFVDPGARREGLGRALLGAAVADATARSLQPVLDVVDDSHDAIALYERTGWRLAGRGRATWPGPDGRKPMLRYYVRAAAG